MKLKEKINNSFNDKTNQLISRFLKPMADTMLKTAYELTDKSETFENYAKRFHVLYKINYQKRKDK